MPVFSAFVTPMSAAIELFFEPSYLSRDFGSWQYNGLRKTALSAIRQRDVAAMTANDGSRDDESETRAAQVCTRPGPAAFTTQ